MIHYPNFAFYLLVFTSIIFLSIGCKKDKGEATENQPLEITNMTIDNENISWNSSCQICVEVINPGGQELTYSWSNTGGEFTSSTDVACVTWLSPNVTGSYTCTVVVSNSTETRSKNIVVEVVDPPTSFHDDFSIGTNQWVFGWCEYAIVDGELSMVSANPDYQAVAFKKTDFQPYASIPWILSGDLTISEDSPLDMYGSGLSVSTGDSGPYAIEAMWFQITPNNENVNWLWLLWVPSLSNSWEAWDDNCYGNSQFIQSDKTKNYLEMSISENKEVTLIANGHTLSLDNQAIKEFESMYNNNVSLSVKSIALRGGTQSSTLWDNIHFYSSGFKGSQMIQYASPPIPTSTEINSVCREIEQKSIVTLKNKILAEKK